MAYIGNNRIITRVFDEGKSAYEVAVKNGFKGTEEEWLESLRAESTEQAIAAANRAIEAEQNATARVKAAEDAAVSHIESLAEGAYDIVQTTGDSETQVMSQKAVTDLFEEEVGLNTLSSSDFVQGLYQAGVGIASSSYWITTKQGVPVSVGDKISIKPTGRKFAAIIVNSDDLTTATAKKWIASGATEDLDYVSGYDGYFICYVGKTDGEMITPDEYNCYIKVGGTRIDDLEASTEKLKTSIEDLGKSVANAVSTVADADAKIQQAFDYTSQDLELNSDTKSGSYYITSDGSKVSSGAWWTYEYDVADIASVKSALLSVHSSEANKMLAVAFYNSEEISADTFIGGYRFDTGTLTETAHIYSFENLPVLPNSVKMVIANRVASLTTPLATIERFAFASTASSAIGAVVSNELSAQKEKGNPYLCFGSPISLDTPRYQVEQLFSAVKDNGGNYFENYITVQDGAVYGNYYFRYFHIGKFAMFDLTSSSFVCEIPITNLGEVVPHGNAVCFGNEFYAETDEFPLLYINAYQGDLPRGTCYAIRIQRVDGTLTAEIVQTISLDFTDNELWYCSGEARPYGNFVIDTDNSLLYAFVPRTSERVYRFFRFTLPKLSDGETVTLSTADILKNFDVAQVVPPTNGVSIPQGACYHNGKAYVLDGGTDNTCRKCIFIVNLFSEKTESVIDYRSIGGEGEPEDINIVNGRMLTGMINVYAYRFH